MEIKNKKQYKSTMTLSIILIAIAISIIITYIFNLYYWIIGPAVILLIVGFWIAILGVFSLKEDPSKFTFGPKESTYLMSWGSLMSIIGFLLLFRWFYPEVNLIIIIAIIILFVGIVSLLTYALHYRKNRSE